MLLVALLAVSVVQAQTATPTACSDRPAVAAGESRHTLVSHNQRREYLRYVPQSYDPTQPTPLVIVLHGIISDGEQIRDFTGWNDYADEHNLIVVYPESVFALDLFVFFPQPEDTQDAVDDVRFVDNLLTPLRHDLCIDNQRIYVSGFSAGGAMALLLACRLPEDIAAIGVMAASYIAPLDDPTWCAPDVPVPLIAFQGRADPIVPYDGGEAFGYTLIGFETWTAGWAARNGCAAAPETLDTVEAVEGRRYTDCAADVVTYSIDDAGHAWAGGEPPPGTRRVTALNATELMWAFFSEHPKVAS